MAYGDYDGPDKADKGHEGGSCNRGRCQAAPALWYNHGSFKWYCADCRKDIEFDSFNLRDWRRNYEPKLGHPMFETREMIQARQSPPPQANKQITVAYAYCCSGSVKYCDCANKNHGTAMMSANEAADDYPTASPPPVSREAGE